MGRAASPVPEPHVVADASNGLPTDLHVAGVLGAAVVLAASGELGIVEGERADLAGPDVVAVQHHLTYHGITRGRRVA